MRSTRYAFCWLHRGAPLYRRLVIARSAHSWSALPGLVMALLSSQSSRYPPPTTTSPSRFAGCSDHSSTRSARDWRKLSVQNGTRSVHWPPIQRAGLCCQPCQTTQSSCGICNLKSGANKHYYNGPECCVEACCPKQATYLTKRSQAVLRELHPGVHPYMAVEMAL